MIEGIGKDIFLLNFKQIILFLKSHHFRKCFHDPMTLHPKIWGSRPPSSRIDAYVMLCGVSVLCGVTDVYGVKLYMYACDVSLYGV